MGAYAAAVSLQQTIRHLLNPTSPSSIAPSSRHIIESVGEELKRLLEDLGRLDENRSCRRRVIEALDGQIRDAVHQLEDAINSHVSNQIRSQSQQNKLLISLEDKLPEVDSLIQDLKKNKVPYINELDNSEEEDDDVDTVNPWSVDFDHGKISNIFGLSDHRIAQVKYDLTRRQLYESGVVSIVGDEDAGRTILAKAIFRHRDVGCYERQAWVSVAPSYEVREIILSLLSQIYPDFKIGDDGELGEQLCTELKGRNTLLYWTTCVIRLCGST